MPTNPVLPAPPYLPLNPSWMDFHQFYRQEVRIFNVDYLICNVAINVDPARLQRLRETGAVLAMTHFGSFFAHGSALMHQMGHKVNLMVSRRNMIPEMMPEREIAFWRYTHKKLSTTYYNNPVLYSDESPRKAIRLLKKGELVVMALDAKEYGQQLPEEVFRWRNMELYLHMGPVRLAKMAGVPLAPISMRFDPKQALHLLTIGEPIYPDDLYETTNKLLHFCLNDAAKAPYQMMLPLHLLTHPWTGTPRWSAKRG